MDHTLKQLKFYEKRTISRNQSVAKLGKTYKQAEKKKRFKNNGNSR